MFFNVQSFDVYRETPAEGFVDGSWSKVGTIRGTQCAMTAADGIRNRQEFADVRWQISADIVYKDDVREKDEVELTDGVRRKVKFKLVMENVLPHIELYLTDVQWERS